MLGLRLGGMMLGARLPDAQFGYVGMLCVATAGMLIAALIHPRLALVVAALLAAQSGLILGNGLRFSLMTLLSSLVAIYAVSDIRSRGDVLRAAALLGATNALLCVIVGRIEGDAWADIGHLLPWAFTTGLVSVALFWLLAALFERPFGVMTHLGLLELSDPNRPLLQKFCQLAPGTYTHSVMVGNLAVAAAEAVGADALLCRVGAYYHDLGKMLKPHYFIENQTGGENIHEKLNPSLSALVLTAHVKDGLEIAEEEKLPPIISQFITEHHGTSLIRYFYHQQTGGEDAGRRASGPGGVFPLRRPAPAEPRDGHPDAGRRRRGGLAHDQQADAGPHRRRRGQDLRRPARRRAAGRVRPDAAGPARHPRGVSAAAHGDAAHAHRVPRDAEGREREWNC